MKRIFGFLLLSGIFNSLQAQYTFTNDSLGVSISFPCPAGEVSTEDYLENKGQLHTCVFMQSEVYTLLLLPVPEEMAQDDPFSEEDPEDLRAGLEEMRDMLIGDALTLIHDTVRSDQDRKSLDFSFANPEYGTTGYCQILIVLKPRFFVCMLLYQTEKKVEEKYWATFRDSFVVKN